MLFRDRRATFKSPQVEALAKASAAGARGIKAMPNVKKENPNSPNTGHYERQDVHYAAREAGWKDTNRYNPDDRGDRYKEGARDVEQKQQAEKKVK
jgi:hypothetical protein